MSYKIIGKYIKDLNFSIPNPKTFFLLTKNIEGYKINIEINSAQIKEKIIEISTSLSLKPHKDFADKINTKIVFTTIVELEDNNLEKSRIEKIILVEVPSKVYSELRNIFINLFEYSGFKDIKINKDVDFEKLYQVRKAQ